ncbi:fibroblast growth factor receptor substrate 2-like [Anguilla anguilla]|uniref:fibroblast growth factor receptor substrate 2-like n=1 Tax=Anguilla anguilla TaxID=7936 RepID=UPI0015A83EAD|nr:fibroblast growth factor receptor substrate 2-like [Anguilla anguilla]XP_035257153.1 fibroblast growth factor receptor substrate 2-like [Anguilla anguilla]
MGSCCSCPDKESIPDNHQSKFKVINVDDDGNELGSGVMELTEEELILHTRKRHAVRWPYLCLRRYGYDSNLFSFESGRRCQTGQGIFAFKCARAEELFNMLQDIMHSNSISVVEEPVLESPQGAPESHIPHTPRTPTTPGYAAPSLPNGIPRYPSFGDASSRPSSRHPSAGSTRLPSVGEESTHPLLVTDELVHTYVNTTGMQDERRSRTSVPPPLELRGAEPESVGAEPPEAEPQVLLDPAGVKFVLGPTPVQRQLMAKEAGPAEQGGGAGEPPAISPGGGRSLNGAAGDRDTGYDSDERKEAGPGPGAKPAYQHLNGSGPAPSRRARPPAPPPPADAQNANNSAQRRTALLNYENLPALTPVWEARKPSSHQQEEEEEREEAFAPKTPSLNGHPHPHHLHLLQQALDPAHNYVNTENVAVPLSAHRPEPARRRDSATPAVFTFDLRRPGPPEPARQLNYIEVEMETEKGSDSSGPHTPKTPTTPLPHTPTRRTELYAVIDIQRTAAMSSLQRALPRDDGTARKTRHNSTDLPM